MSIADVIETWFKKEKWEYGDVRGSRGKARSRRSKMGGKRKEEG